MLDTPIIVSDEEIKEGSKYLDELFQISIAFKNRAGFYKDSKKIIAGLPELPSIDFNRFEEQLGIVDVEKLSIEHCKPDYDKFGGELEYVERQYWIRGFQAAQKLNEKKFSLEDIKRLQQAILCNHKDAIMDDEYGVNFLSQPKVFDIEVEMEAKSRERKYSDNSWVDSDYIPKITNNRIKITKICGV